MAQNITLRRLVKEFTRPADTTAYTAQDGVANATSGAVIITFDNTRSDDGKESELVAGGSYQIKSAKLSKSTVGTTNATFDLHLFASGVTAVNDNAEYGLLYKEKHLRIGKVAFSLITAGTTNSDTAENVVSDINLVFKALTNTLSGILTATAAYTPGNAEKFYIELFLIRIDA